MIKLKIVKMELEELEKIWEVLEEIWNWKTYASGFAHVQDASTVNNRWNRRQLTAEETFGSWCYEPLTTMEVFVLVWFSLFLVQKQF